MTESVGDSTSSAGWVEAFSSSLTIPIVVSTAGSSAVGRVVTDRDGEVG